MNRSQKQVIGLGVAMALSMLFAPHRVDWFASTEALVTGGLIRRRIGPAAYCQRPGRGSGLRRGGQLRG